MLHDPRHDKVPSLAGFALFVASKPADERYDWRDCRHCPFGEYLRSLGLDPMVSDNWDWSGNAVVMNRLARGPLLLEDGGTGDGVSGLFDRSLWTYGQLADRILAHQMAAA